MALEYNDAGYWYGRVWCQPLSIALFDNQNIYVLEKIGDDHLFPQIQPGDKLSIYWEKGSTSNFFLYDILFDDENKLWYINKIDRTDIDHINTFDGLKYPLDINIAFNPTDEIAYNAKMFITLNGVIIAQIDFYGEGVMEDERFAVWLANFGIKFNREDALLIKDYDIKEAAPNWDVINQKRKELIANQEEIFPYIGTYRGVSNIIGIMGFDGVLRLKEYWKNIDSSSSYFNKFLLTDVTDVMNTGTVELTNIDALNLDENNKHIQASSTFKKTGFLALSYEFMVETGENDEDGLPITEYTTDFTFDEVFYKLAGLKKKLEREFLPANVKVLDIIGEYLYYTKFTFRAWSDNIPIFESYKADKIGILVEPYGPLNIRDLKPLYRRPYADGISFPQYIFNNTDVQLFSDNQKYPYSKMQDMVDCFKNYYASMLDRTGKEYEEDTRPWEMGDDFISSTGCPVVLTLDVPGLTIGEMDGVELSDMMFGFAKKPNNDGIVTITPHSGYDPGSLITYTLTYIAAGGSPTIQLTNNTGVFTDIPVSKMQISILDGNGLQWETILPMADYNETWIETITKDSISGFDVMIKDNTKSPNVNKDGMLWIKPIDGYDPGFPVTYQISYDDNGPVTRTQISNGLFVSIPASTIIIAVTDSNGTYTASTSLNVGTIAEQWQIKGLVGNFEVKLKDCTQVPITPHTYENISYKNMYEIEWVIEKDDNPAYNWSYRGPIKKYNPWNGQLESLTSIAHVLPAVGNYVAKAYVYDYMGGVSMKFEMQLLVVSTSIPHIIALMRLDDKFDMKISNMSNILLSDMSMSKWYDMRINVLGSDDADARVKKYLMEWDYYSNTKDDVKIYEESYAQLGYDISNPSPGLIIRFLDITNNDSSHTDYIIPNVSPFTLQSLAYEMNHTENLVIGKFSHSVKNGKIIATSRNNFAASYYQIQYLNIDETTSNTMTGSDATYMFTPSYRNYDDSTSLAKINWLTEYGTSNKLSDYSTARIHDTYFLRGCDTVYSANFLAGFELINPVIGNAIRFNTYYKNSIRIGHADYLIPTYTTIEDLVYKMNLAVHPVISLFVYSVVNGNVRAASKELTDLAYQFIDHVYSTTVVPIPGESIFVPVGYQYVIPDNIPLETDALSAKLNEKNIGLNFSSSSPDLSFIKQADGYWYTGNKTKPKQGEIISVPVTYTFKIPYDTPTDVIDAANYLNSVLGLLVIPEWAEFYSEFGQLYLVSKHGLFFNFSMLITDYSAGAIVTYPELGYFRIPDDAPRDSSGLATFLNLSQSIIPSTYTLTFSENIGSPTGMLVQSDLSKVSYRFDYVASPEELVGLNAYVYAPVFEAYQIQAETILDVNELASILNVSLDPMLTNMSFSVVDGKLVTEFSATGYQYSKTYSDVTFGDEIQCIIGDSYVLPSISPSTTEAYVELLNSNSDNSIALSKMRFYLDNGIIIGVGLTGKDTPSPMYGSKYTFFEPIWAYTPDFAIHIESQRTTHGHRLHPNFKKELMFLFCNFSDILSGAADNPEYFFDKKYITWRNNNIVGSLPSVLDKDTFALDSLKIRTNAFCAPKFCTVFFTNNNIANVKQCVWSIYQSVGGKLSGRVSDVPFLSWRFDEAGSYDVAVEITDNNGNVFSDRLERFVTVLEKQDYISYVENLLNQRKAKINKPSIS